MKNIGVAILLLSLSACAATHRGSVAMKVSDTEAHVCLGPDEVKVGDTVAAYRNDCNRVSQSKTQARVPQTCEKKFLGNGMITQLLNEHYSLAQFPASIGFKEGDVVERIGG